MNIKSSDMAQWAGTNLHLDGIELSPNEDGRLHSFGDEGSRLCHLASCSGSHFRAKEVL